MSQLPLILLYVIFGRSTTYECGHALFCIEGGQHNQTYIFCHIGIYYFQIYSLLLNATFDDSRNLSLRMLTFPTESHLEFQLRLQNYKLGNTEQKLFDACSKICRWHWNSARKPSGFSKNNITFEKILNTSLLSVKLNKMFAKTFCILKIVIIFASTLSIINTDTLRTL